MVKKQSKVKVQKEIVKSIPVGVKVLSILAYIGAAFAALIGVMMIAGSGFFSSLLSAIPGYAEIATWGAIAFILMGLMIIACGVLDYFIGRGLWNGRNWARILLLVFAVLGILGSLTSFSLINLVISAVVIWYLGFNKEAIAYFK
ncbi:MAG: hypothetical protein AABX17_01290 [Nanoarchaeota archaeon]